MCVLYSLLYKVAYKCYVVNVYELLFVQHVLRFVSVHSFYWIEKTCSPHYMNLTTICAILLMIFYLFYPLLKVGIDLCSCYCRTIYFSLQICQCLFIYFGALLFGVYMLIIFVSSWWIDPLSNIQSFVSPNDFLLRLFFLILVL